MVSKVVWKNNPNNSHSIDLLLTLLFLTFNVYLSLTSIVVKSDYPSFVTHSSNPKALTIGYGVVKPNVSFVIDYFSFFTFGELDWIDCLASSLSDGDVSSTITCVTNIIVFPNKGSNIWYLDDGLKMIFNHFHVLGFSACCDWSDYFFHFLSILFMILPFSVVWSILLFLISTSIHHRF